MYLPVNIFTQIYTEHSPTLEFRNHRLYNKKLCIIIAHKNNETFIPYL